MGKKIAEVYAIPNCYFCEEEGEIEKASYDGETIHGSWAYMCEKHFKEYGTELGIGKGQKLVKVNE